MIFIDIKSPRFVEANSYNSQAEQPSKRQSAQATNTVLACEDLVSKILSFTEPVLGYYKYAHVSKTFNGAWMAKDVSLYIIAPYDRSKVRSLEGFSDVIFLRKQVINAIRSLNINYLIRTKPKVIQDESDGRLVEYVISMIFPWIFLGILIADNHSAPK
jgi:hypothetical protein